MPMTAAQIAEAKAAAERLEQANQRARGGMNSRTEQMLNAQQPPGMTNSLGSENKPFSLHRFLTQGMAKSSPENAPHEMDVCTKYTKALQSTSCMLHGGTGFWLPLNMNETYGGQLVSNSAAEADYNYVKAVMNSTRPAYDPDEAAWLVRNKYVKAQSAYDETLGGSLVAPPVQGDVIPLIRPQAAFLAAGAQAITLPPNGRFVRPRITGAPNVRAVGEAQEALVSNLTTDQMELTAKKIAGLCQISEESSAFTSGTLDNIAQSELGRSLGLKADAYAFYGTGGTQIPAGLTSNMYASQIINIENDYPTCQGLGADGNRLLPQYGDIFPSLVAERSFSVDAGTGAWVMRPSPYATAVALRADAVTPGDQAGPNVDILRKFGDARPDRWRGRGVVQTTNIDNTGVKNNGTGLSDVFYGIWQYAMMATYGAINFQQGHNGTTFATGQFLIRGTMYGDVGFLYPAAFLWYPYVMGLGSNF